MSRWLSVALVTALTVTRVLSASTSDRSASSGSQCAAGEYCHGVGVREWDGRPLVIAHRGSSGQYPEHSIKAYEAAVRDGADVLECDVCVTRDLRLVCMHESWMSEATDVGALPEFSARKTTRYVDDYYGNVNDWFSDAFLLSELRLLRIRQRNDFRDQRFNWQFGIPTLEEFFQVAQSAGRPVGVHLETKNPAMVNKQAPLVAAGVTLEDLLVRAVTEADPARHTPAFVQSFSEASLLAVRNKTADYHLVMLTWADVPTAASLDRWRRAGFYGIGPSKKQLISTTDAAPKFANNRTTGL